MILCEKKSLQHRHFLTVGDGAFIHKIDYFTIFKEILSPEGHPKLHYLFKSYGDYAEWVDFAYW